MGKVINLDIPTVGDVQPDKVLKAHEGELEEVVLIGVDEKGEYVFAGSTSDPERLLWLVEAFKNKIINSSFDDETW